MVCWLGARSHPSASTSPPPRGSSPNGFKSLAGYAAIRWARKQADDVTVGDVLEKTFRCGPSASRPIRPRTSSRSAWSSRRRRDAEAGRRDRRAEPARDQGRRPGQRANPTPAASLQGRDGRRALCPDRQGRVGGRAAGRNCPSTWWRRRCTSPTATWRASARPTRSRSSAAAQGRLHQAATPGK